MYDKRFTFAIYFFQHVINTVTFRTDDFKYTFVFERKSWAESFFYFRVIYQNSVADLFVFANIAIVVYFTFVQANCFIFGGRFVN